MGEAPGEATLLLRRTNTGDQGAMAELIPVVYKELRRLAGRFMRDERVSHTLQPTALVHEAWLRLLGQDRADWRNRAQFMAIAAQMMRRILVDHARQRKAGKRAAPASLQPEWDGRIAAGQWAEILAVDEALGRLRELDIQQATIVEMRYFGGLSVEEAAEDDKS